MFISIWKIFIKFFEDNFSLTNNSYIDLLIVLTIESFGLIIAYKFVGKVAPLVNYNKKIMSSIHWVTRILIIICMTILIYKFSSLIN